MNPQRRRKGEWNERKGKRKSDGYRVLDPTEEKKERKKEGGEKAMGKKEAVIEGKRKNCWLPAALQPTKEKKEFK